MKNNMSRYIPQQLEDILNELIKINKQLSKMNKEAKENSNADNKENREEAQGAKAVGRPRKRAQDTEEATLR